MKPIDWPRILADPDAFADHLPRLDARISRWPAVCELCQIDPHGMAGFDRQLMILVRDFFQIVKRREWHTAEAMYDEIMATRERLSASLGVPTKIKPKPQPVG